MPLDGVSAALKTQRNKPGAHSEVKAGLKDLIPQVAWGCAGEYPLLYSPLRPEARGLTHLIVDRSGTAKKAFASAGLVHTEGEVLQLELPNTPGALEKVRLPSNRS